MVKISVIVPVYNAENFLDESINSLLNQTFTDIEVICVNDGAKDNSLEMLQNFSKIDSRVKVIDKENGGCGSARNRSLDNATGEYVYFFDPDDYLIDVSFEKLYQNAINNDSDLVISKIARFRDGKPVDYSIPGYDFEKKFPNVNFDSYTFDYHDVKEYVLNASFAPWTKLYKKAFLDKYGDFRFPENVAFDDVPFHVKSMIRAKKISFVPEFFYRYRLSNPNSVNNTSSNGIDIFRICDIVEDILKQEKCFDEFISEFVYFKIRQVINYILTTATEEYFQVAKSEFLKINSLYFSNKCFDKSVIPLVLMNRFKKVLISDSFKEYKVNIDLINANKKDMRISKENKQLKEKNQSINKKLSALSDFKKGIIDKDIKSLDKKIKGTKLDMKKNYSSLDNLNSEFNNTITQKLKNSNNIWPLLSIILPSYNVVDYIDECIKSVLNQTLKNIEIICVDANSTDGTLEILKEYSQKDSRIKLIISDEKSYGHQMNLGISEARGEYIGIVETDDYIKEDMFETLYMLTENSTVDIAKVNFWHMNKNYSKIIDLKVDGTKQNLPEIKFTIFDDENILNGHPCIWAAIYKRKLLIANNIKFMEEPGGAWVDNPFLFETMIHAKSIKYLDKPYYYYRESNLNSSTNNLSDLTLPMKRMNNVLDILENNSCNNEKVLKALYVRIFWHFRDILSKDNFEEQKEMTCSSMYQVAKRMNKKIIKKYFKKQDVDLYEKILSFSSYVTNILLVSSDNNKTSGAFLSMANLALNLKNKYHLGVKILLPYDSHGKEVLNSLNLEYDIIPSEDWVIPLSKLHDKDVLPEIERKKKVNEEAINKITQYLKSNKIDLVHINTTYSYVAAIASLKVGIPFVWHLREFLEEDQNNTLWDRKKGNELINKSTKVIAISDSIYKKYENIFDKEKLVRVHNGIDATRFYKPTKKLFENSTIKFIFVGGFEYYKGQTEFAEACVKLYQKGYTNFEVNFVGLGTRKIREEVKDIFEKANITNVNFLGYKYDVENYYDKADISFTCAKSEAFGRTTVEAMLSGNLVIGADTAGTKELICDKKTGLLYKQGSTDDLCNKIIEAITNKELSRQIASTGRKYMYHNMTSERNADKIYEIYAQILDES